MGWGSTPATKKAPAAPEHLADLLDGHELLWMQSAIGTDRGLTILDQDLTAITLSVVKVEEDALESGLDP